MQANRFSSSQIQHCRTQILAMAQSCSLEEAIDLLWGEIKLVASQGKSTMKISHIIASVASSDNSRNHEIACYIEQLISRKLKEESAAS